MKNENTNFLCYVLITQCRKVATQKCSHHLTNNSWLPASRQVTAVTSWALHLPEGIAKPTRSHACRAETTDLLTERPEKLSNHLIVSSLRCSTE